MIHFFSETAFELQDQDFYRDWMHACMDKENRKIGHVNIIFCDDEYLLKINQQHLQHDFYTDIITFDYAEEEIINGDIFISVERVADNAFDFESGFDNELARVMIHGFLHIAGYQDKTEQEQKIMRNKEESCLELMYHTTDDETE